MQPCFGDCVLWCSTGALPLLATAVEGGLEKLACTHLQHVAHACWHHCNPRPISAIAHFSNSCAVSRCPQRQAWCSAVSPSAS